MEKIEAILFDWVGVLLRQKNPEKASLNSKAVNDYLSLKWKKCNSKSELINILQIPESQFDEVMMDYINDYFEKYDPLWKILPKLYEKYKLAVVNNGPQITVPYFQKIFNFQNYGEFINSEQVGYWKPDKKIFEITLNLLNVKNQNALYMDDADMTDTLTSTTGIFSFQWKNHDEGMKKLSTILSRPSESNPSDS